MTQITKDSLRDVLSRLRTLLIVTLVLFFSLLFTDPPYSIIGEVISALIVVSLSVAVIQVHRYIFAVKNNSAS
jgi:hypothetical protein